MRVRNLCVVALAVVLYAWAAVPARADFIGITNGDFEAQSGLLQTVTNWNESSTNTSGAMFFDWLNKDATGASYVNLTEVFGMSKPVGWIYQQVGTYSAGLQMTVSGDAILGKGTTAAFRGFTVELWTGGTASLAADTKALDTVVGATMVASRAYAAADFGFTTGSGPKSAHWTTPVLTPTGTVGSALWLRIAAGTASGETFLDNITATASTVPEPSTLVLLGISLAGLLAYAWKKR